MNLAERLDVVLGDGNIRDIRARSGLGHGHHLSEDLRPVPYDDRSRSASPVDGRVAAQTHRQGRGPFRPGVPIHQPGVADISSPARPGTQHEPGAAIATTVNMVSQLDGLTHATIDPVLLR